MSIGDCISNSIDSDVTYHGLNFEELDRDITVLLDGEYATVDELRELCTALEHADQSLGALYQLIEDYLPHRNKCNDLCVVGENRLLSMFMSIQDSHHDFSTGVTIVRQRVEKILTGKEQASLL